MPETFMTVANNTGRPLVNGPRLIIDGGTTVISFSEYQTHVFSDGKSNVVITKQNDVVDFSTNGDLVYEETKKIKRNEKEERRYVSITAKTQAKMA